MSFLCERHWMEIQQIATWGSLFILPIFHPSVKVGGAWTDGCLAEVLSSCSKHENLGKLSQYLSLRSQESFLYFWDLEIGGCRASLDGWRTEPDSQPLYLSYCFNLALFCWCEFVSASSDPPSMRVYKFASVLPGYVFLEADLACMLVCISLQARDIEREKKDKETFTRKMSYERRILLWPLFLGLGPAH